MRIEFLFEKTSPLELNGFCPRGILPLYVKKKKKRIAHDSSSRAASLTTLGNSSILLAVYGNKFSLLSNTATPQNFFLKQTEHENVSKRPFPSSKKRNDLLPTILLKSINDFLFELRHKKLATKYCYVSTSSTHPHTICTGYKLQICFHP